MSSKYTPPEADSEHLEINVSPLIDVVFMLLIFFVVTAVFSRDPAVDINRPSATTAQRLEKETLLFAITASGRLYHGGAEIPLDKLRSLVERTPKTPLVVRADKQSRTERLIEVIDVARAAGARSVSVATRTPSSEIGAL